MTLIANPRRASDVDQYIAARIREWRIARQITQMELGEALGVTFQQVQKYENGRNRITGGRLDDIARALEITVAELMPPGDGEPDRKPDPVRTMLANRADRALLERIAALSTAQRAALLPIVTAIDTGARA